MPDDQPDYGTEGEEGPLHLHVSYNRGTPLFSGNILTPICLEYEFDSCSFKETHIIQDSPKTYCEPLSSKQLSIEEILAILVYGLLYYTYFYISPRNVTFFF